MPNSLKSRAQALCELLGAVDRGEKRIVREEEEEVIDGKVVSTSSYTRIVDASDTLKCPHCGGFVYAPKKQAAED